MGGWEGGIGVEGGGTTEGFVEFIEGWKIPFHVTSACEAVLHLRVQDWTLSVTQQHCGTSL